MALLARLKPYNERKRHLVRTYMIDGARFFEERGWYEVSDALGERLRPLTQDYHDEDSPKLFDVCTKEEAEALEQREAEAEVKASAKRPAQVVTTRSQSSRRAESGDMTSADVVAPAEPTKLLDPDPAGEELADDVDDGRLAEVGRVSGSKPPSGPKERRRGGR